MNPRITAIVAFALTVATEHVAVAVENDAKPSASTVDGSVTLTRVLELADRNHPTIATSQAKLAFAEAQRDEARAAPFSQFKASGGLSVAPTVRGNSVFSPNTDVSLTSSLGLAWRAGIEGVLPLWTFGRITSAWSAADAGVKVATAQVEVDRDAVRLDVRKAYFGLQLARDGLALLADARAQIERALERLSADVEAGKADEIELLKLQVFLADLESRESEAKKYVGVALAGLRFYTGMADLDVPEVPLREPKHALGPVTRYLAAARLYRPEANMAKAGVAARTAQLHLARANLYPNLGLGLSAGLSTAPLVADQINPFVTDPGNYFHYGAGLVFEWKLDVAPALARIHQAEAQLEEVRAQERMSLVGVGAEVETAYNDVLDWKRKVDAFRTSTKRVRRWLVIVQEGIDVGTMDDKDLLDPARQYALQRFNLLNALMELNMAMCRLAKTTGWDAIAPDGT
jgi:outer membrane protein TolC